MMAVKPSENYRLTEQLHGWFKNLRSRRKMRVLLLAEDLPPFYEVLRAGYCRRGEPRKKEVNH